MITTGACKAVDEDGMDISCPERLVLEPGLSVWPPGRMMPPPEDAVVKVIGGNLSDDGCARGKGTSSMKTAVGSGPVDTDGKDITCPDTVVWEPNGSVCFPGRTTPLPSGAMKMETGAIFDENISTIGASTDATIPDFVWGK